jgi:hypothetical protein
VLKSIGFTPSLTTLYRPSRARVERHVFATGPGASLRIIDKNGKIKKKRAVGDHDRSTLRLRVHPQGDTSGLEPGMTVWLSR